MRLSAGSGGLSDLLAVSVVGVGLENSEPCAPDLLTLILVKSFHFTDGNTVDL